uniref:Uncharacterized protein n=1 Tax=Cucumis melo TaxID=3656 RepID=A0A9I9DIA7_CUCME
MRAARRDADVRKVNYLIEKKEVGLENSVLAVLNVTVVVEGTWTFWVCAVPN